MTRESNCFLKEGIGSFGTRGTFSHLLSFFFMSWDQGGGQIYSNKGEPLPIFFFVIKGEGLFSAKISIFLMSDRFVGCPGIRVVGRFIKIQGNLCPI